MDPELVPWAELFELPVVDAPAPTDEAPKRQGFFRRLRDSLGGGTEQAISPQLAAIYAPRLVTEDTWDELEEALIMADCGMEATDALVSHLRQEAREGRVTSGATLAQSLWREVARLMAPEPARVPLDGEPTVILVIGVNGSGKTTTIGKLAYRLTELGQKVVIGAGDTFRAAAGEQLEVWAKRSGAQLIRQAPGADPGAVTYDAIAAGRARGADVVIIDTAGRLQTQKNLMEELRKVASVAGKLDPSAPHETLLVLDATTGQNGISQALLFNDVAKLTGVVLTKLDGIAKGGIVLSIQNQLGVPVKLVGVGEALEDLQPFDAEAFARAIFAPPGE
jgi:fused signal recognition particle receptor